MSSVSPRPVDEPCVSLGALLRAWGDAGEAPPTSIVAAILHDVARVSADAHEPSDGVEVESIWIDGDGEVSLEAPLSVPALAELMDLGLSGYAPGRTGDLMPPAARSGIDRFRDWDATHEDGCEAFAAWIRSHFGPLPEPTEVARCCRASAPLDPDAPTALPTRAPSASELPAPSVVPEPAVPEPLEVPDEVSSDSLEPTGIDADAPTALDTGVERLVESLPPPPSREEATETGSVDLAAESSSDERPVVRRELPSRRERTASLVSAPAARRSARPLADHGDSILVPADRGAGRSWFLVLLGVGLAVAVYFWLVP